MAAFPQRVPPPDPNDAMAALAAMMGMGDDTAPNGNAADAAQGATVPVPAAIQDSGIPIDPAQSAEYKSPIAQPVYGEPAHQSDLKAEHNAPFFANVDKLQALDDMFNKPGGTKDVENLKNKNAMDLAAVAPTIQAKSATDVETMKEAADKYKADQGLAAAGLKAGGGVKLTSTEQAVVDAGIAGKNEGDRVRQMLEARHPDIATNPDKYSSVTDRLPAAIGNLLIAHGVAAGTHTNSTEMNTAITQLQANIAKMKSSGRLSGAIYDKLIQGMPQAGFSDGENYKRLASTQADLDDVLGGVAQAHGAQLTDLTHSGAQAPADTSASDYNDPAGLR